MSDKLGLKEAYAMAIGGMIGGGIYSAFGIVVGIAGNVAWLSFFGAGVVAMCAGYSYVKLNDLADTSGGAPTFIQEFLGNHTLAGMTGWTLLFGYIGSMALYAYAFSSFFSELLGRMHYVLWGFGIPVANTVAVALIAVFVGLNLLGASETGKAEDVLSFFKVGVILIFGVWGVWYAFSDPNVALTLGLGSIGFSPLMAAAMSFVAFQGWQLLMYSQGQFENPEQNIKRAIYMAIPSATVLYVLVAFTTVSILQVPLIAVSPEVSLLYAALPFMGQLGAFVIGLSALFSTASAVNATLFSGALFSRDLVNDGLLPERLGGSTGGSDQGIPKRMVVILGILSAAFAVYGSLSSITSFASLAFIAVFGGMSYLAFAKRDEADLFSPIPLVGLVGTVLFFPLLLYNLYLNNPGTFYLVLIISAVVVGSELFYFEREPIEEVLPFVGADQN